MTSLDPSRDWVFIPTWPPPVKDLAKRYPERTYVRTIPHRDLFEEEWEIRRKRCVSIVLEEARAIGAIKGASVLAEVNELAMDKLARRINI
ncbi:hypothetical protein [Mesorhizobium sp. KR2-14]|uniref:hypothetical protein n=1 Tax=Mesorhizobium sp. KR2-14 TaxID=3156610 RepID=UPI0032B3FA2E